MTSRCSHTCTRKQNTCTQQIIYDQQPHIWPNNQAPPINYTTQKAKSSNSNAPTPHKTNHTFHRPPKTKITPKASQTADLNCLNFKLAVPPPKQGHTQRSCPTRSSQPSTLFIPKQQDSKHVEIKI